MNRNSESYQRLEQYIDMILEEFDEVSESDLVRDDDVIENVGLALLTAKRGMRRLREYAARNEARQQRYGLCE